MCASQKMQVDQENAQDVQALMFFSCTNVTWFDLFNVQQHVPKETPSEACVQQETRCWWFVHTVNGNTSSLYPSAIGTGRAQTKSGQEDSEGSRRTDPVDPDPKS